MREFLEISNKRNSEYSEFLEAFKEMIPQYYLHGNACSKHQSHTSVSSVAKGLKPIYFQRHIHNVCHPFHVTAHNGMSNFIYTHIIHALSVTP